MIAVAQMGCRWFVMMVRSSWDDAERTETAMSMSRQISMQCGGSSARGLAPIKSHDRCFIKRLKTRQRAKATRGHQHSRLVVYPVHGTSNRSRYALHAVYAEKQAAFPDKVEAFDPSPDHSISSFVGSSMARYSRIKAESLSPPPASASILS
jgi:hypothetical protein